ncbi:MAG: PAS domain S-box protein [Chloroflexi bacterium]|nr:PAS domain S-box protein [Chloroflexota bacterium]
MKIEHKTQEQLIDELTQLRQRVSELEALEAERKQSQDSSQDREGLLKKIFAESPIAIQLCDADGKFIDMNQACLDMFGMSSISDYDYQWRGIFDGPFMPADGKARLQTGDTVRFEAGFDFDDVRKQGIYKGKKTGASFYDILVSPLLLEKGSTSGYVFQMQDITERKRAEKALKESEELFRSIYTESPIAILLCDSDGKFIDMNKACLNMFRLSDISHYAGPGIFNGTYMPEKIKRQLFKGKVVRYEVMFDFDKEKRLGIFTKSRPGVAYYDVLVNPLGLSKASSGAYLVQIQEITELKQSEKMLRDLSHRLVEVQESERRNIARELHDEIGQALTGLKLLVEMATRKAGNNMNLGLSNVESLINELMARVSDLSLNLRPSMLDDLGLLPTLLWHFERYKSQTGIKIVFKHDGLHRRFAPEVETAIYRMVQEALTNVARHAKVQKVNVRLVAKEDMLTVKIEDNGCGFDPEIALATGESSGLVGMSERAISIGGQLTINSIPGSGTLLTAEIPLGDPIKDTLI